MENNNNINNRFDEFFKNSFESFEPSLPDSTWNEIDQSVSNASTGSSVAGAKTVISIIIKAAAVILPLAGITYFVLTSTSEEDQKSLLQTEQIGNKEGTASGEVISSDNTTETNTQPVEKEETTKEEAVKQHNSSEREIRKVSGSNQFSHKGISQPTSTKSVEHSNSSLASKPSAQKPVSGNATFSANSDVLNFTVDKTELCAGEIVEFNNLSKGFDRFRWDFDD